MAKLRKMLGKLSDPEIVALMSLIETQSKETLAKWSAACARNRYLPILSAHKPDEKRLESAIADVNRHLTGELTAKELKKSLSAARKAAQECTDDPIAQAAARAISTACAVIFTPTNALGFTFYGAAAAAYKKAGLSENPQRYDVLAREELRELLESLKSVAIPDEPNPAKIDWNC